MLLVLLSIKSNFHPSQTSNYDPGRKLRYILNSKENTDSKLSQFTSIYSRGKKLSFCLITKCALNRKSRLGSSALKRQNQMGCDQDNIYLTESLTVRYFHYD